MFVTSAGYKDAVREILTEPGETSMAVAFWGHGSHLLLDGRCGTARVICNLSSGATNPEPIELLLKMANVQLRHHDYLHAKVVISRNSALVGSANISSNGLNLEGEELGGWEEAGVLTRNTEDVQVVKSWFDALWSKSRSIEVGDIEEAKVKWKLRRANRIGMPGKTPNQGFSLEAIAVEELSDRAVVVAIYKDWVSDEAKAAYRVKYEEITGVPMAKSARLPPMYENWRSLPKDVQIVDVYYGKRSVKCFGILTRTLDIEFKYKDKTSGHLAICRKDTDLLGYKFQSSDATRFAAALKPHIESIWNSALAVGDEGGRIIPLAEVARICG